MAPVGLFHGEPVAEGLQTEVEHPLWFVLFLRDESHHLFVQSAGYHLGLHISGEAKFVFLFSHLSDNLVRPTFVTFVHVSI